MITLINFMFSTIASIVAGIFDVVFDGLKSLIAPDRKTELNARFIPASELLSSSNKGFCLTGRESLSIQDSFKNALVIGSTGNYKSSGILIPSILKMRGHSSLVITDFNGELMQKCSGPLLEVQNIFCLPA